MEQQHASLPRRRAACDRCHAQKLCCLKSNSASAGGSEICVRCLKARVPCVYSPSLRGYKPPAPEVIPASSLMNGDGVFLNGRSPFSHPIARRGDDFGSSMDVDWNDPGAFDTLPDFGMVESLNDFSLGEGALGQNGSGHSPGAAGNGSTTYSNHGNGGGNLGGTFFSKNGDNEFFSRQGFFITPAESGSDSSSKEMHGDGSQCPFNGNKPPSHGCKIRSKISDDPRAILLHELNSLSQCLYEHQNSLPSMPTQEQIAASFQESSTTNDSDSADGSLPSLGDRQKDYARALDKQFALDNTFELTQTLIDFYPRFTETILLCKPPLAAELPSNLRFHILTRKSRSEATTSREASCMEESPGPNGNKTSTTSSLSPPDDKPPRTALDHASILLLLSCHLRLMEIYEDIFSHSQMCCHEAMKPGRNPHTMSSNVPVLKVGSYTPPTTSTSYLHLMLLEQLVEQLLERIEDFLVEIRKVEQRNEEMFLYVNDGEGDDEGENSKGGKNKTSGRGNPLIDVTELTCMAVKDRSSGLLDTVTSFRRLLLKQGWVRGPPRRRSQEGRQNYR